LLRVIIRYIISNSRDSTPTQHIAAVAAGTLGSQRRGNRDCANKMHYKKGR